MDTFLPDLLRFNAVRPSPALALGYTSAQVAEVARACVKQLKAGIGQDLDPLIAQLNGTVVRAPFVWGRELELDVVGHSFRIFPSGTISPERERFEIAHALGHWVLHFQTPNQSGSDALFWLQVSTLANTPATLEANWFAFEFLMPREAVVKTVQSYGALDSDQLIHRVAQEFVVTTFHARIRLTHLKLIEKITA